jgi:fibro-slime domain-containing protein
VTWSVASQGQIAQPANGYAVSGNTRIGITLAPLSSWVSGDEVEVVSDGAGGFRLSFSAGETGAIGDWTLNAWTDRTALIVQSWSAVASDSTGQHLVAVASKGDIWTSSDSGATWTDRTASTGASGLAWTAVASDASGQHLVAAAKGGDIWTSANSGATWTDQTASGTQLWSAVASDASGQSLVAAVNSGSLWTSINSGATWTARAGTAGQAWSAVASNSTGQNLVAVVNGGDIWTSTNAGASWTNQTASLASSGLAWWSVASDSTGQNLVAAANGGDIWTSTNAGVSWTDQTASTGPSGLQQPVVASDSTGQNLVVAVNGGDLWTSANAGVAWTDQTAGSAGSGQPWSAIASDSTGENRVAAATDLFTFNGALYGDGFASVTLLYVGNGEFFELSSSGNPLTLSPPGAASVGEAPDAGSGSPSDAGTTGEGPDAGSGAGSDAGPAAVCGDGIVETGEQCDDGNLIPFDGCSPTCTIEPTCTGACADVCGDGIISGAEQCDDGNRASGDGCSSSCTIEPGWSCKTAEATPSQLTLPILYRDMLYAGTIIPGPGHPDFNDFICGIDTGMVSSSLGSDNKPVPGANLTSCATSETSFCWWYHDQGCEGAGTANTYEQLVSSDLSGHPTTLTLPLINGAWHYSSTDFFPVDSLGWNANGGQAQTDHACDGTAGHNFAFTSELHYPFVYLAGGSPVTFTFTGDDDAWLYINGHLAVDLGGVHGAATGTVTLNAANAQAYGLTDETLYSMDFFQAERHTCGSDYTLTLSGLSLPISQCTFSGNADAGTASDAGSGMGQCVSCGAYACADSSADCKTTCSQDTDCASGYSCIGSQCATKLAQGAACAASEQCSTGSCVSGVCCNSACTGQCQACSGALTGEANGTCADVTAGRTDPAGICQASASSTCGLSGLCGSGGTCADWTAGTTCTGTTTCSGSTLSTPTQCDGSGSCDEGMTSSACPGLYVCGSSVACKTSCQADSDCTTNACNALSDECVTDQCLDNRKDGQETDVDCGGGTCSACGLAEACVVDSDCQSNACDGLTYTCDADQCSDNRKDGKETDVDCGGGTCRACGSGEACLVSSDCASGDSCNASNQCSSGSCAAETIANCVLSTTNNGGTAGTCASGDSGSCSFVCSDGTWFQVSDTCAPLGCFIDGMSYPPGAVNPNAACQTCEPAVSMTTFTNVPPGANTSSCQASSGDFCDGFGSCVSDCFVNGTLYPSGAVNPNESCQTCQPAASTTTFTNAPAGANTTSCLASSGDACNGTGACVQKGCSIDSDCASGQVCDGTTHACTSCVPTGDNVVVSAASCSVDCCNGGCVSGTTCF